VVNHPTSTLARPCPPKDGAGEAKLGPYDMQRTCNIPPSPPHLPVRSRLLFPAVTPAACDEASTDLDDNMLLNYSGTHTVAPAILHRPDTQ